MHYDLKSGYEFSPVTFELSPAFLTKYLQAVEESSGMYQTPPAKVPPMAIAAYAMRILSESIQLLPGAIHTSQELEFVKPVQVGTKITCLGKIAGIRSRGNMHLLSIDLFASNQDGEKVFSGRASLILPR